MAQKSSNKAKYLIILAILAGISIFALPVLAIGFFGIVYTQVARPFQVKGEAMYPNYKDGQYYLTSIYRQGDELKRGDVIIFKAPPSPDRDYIKRIIGLPGEEIMLKDGAVYINGKILTENYNSGVETQGSTFLSDGKAVMVPEGQYFVMGDNRNYSSDSREWGFVPQANIISLMGTCYKGCK